MAGLGRKEWSPGDTLNAADVNGYLMDQSVMVFAGTAARSSAIPSPSAGMVAYSTATSLEVYNGSDWVGVQSTPVYVAMFNETQTSGTNGGGSSSAWTKRTLNTTVVNEISGCSIASSVITLPAGTYDIWAIAPAYVAAEFKIKLRNTTAGTDDIIGSSERNAVGGGTGTISTLQGRVVITGNTNFELQMYVVTAAATVGFGVASGLGVSEIYSQIKIEKVA
jgi:hypothetical protein